MFPLAPCFRVSDFNYDFCPTDKMRYQSRGGPMPGEWQSGCLAVPADEA